MKPFGAKGWIGRGRPIVEGWRPLRDDLGRSMSEERWLRFADWDGPRVVGVS